MSRVRLLRYLLAAVILAMSLAVGAMTHGGGGHAVPPSPPSTTAPSAGYDYVPTPAGFPDGTGPSTD